MEDVLAGFIADRLKQSPSHRILAVVPTAARAGAMEQRFTPAVKAVTPMSQLLAHSFDVIVTEVEPTGDVWDWLMKDVAPTRMAPGATIWRVWPEA